MWSANSVDTSDHGEADPVEFIELNADAQEALKFKSLCMKCMDSGETRMILTKIPHFREVMVCSFECPHCGNRNNEIQFTGAYGETGVRYTLTVPEGDAETLSRQVVKSDSAVITVPELDFEIPAATQKGKISTVEGLMSEAASDLRLLQDERRAAAPETAAALDSFLTRLDAAAAGQAAFTLVLDDPAGNSYVESPGGPTAADQLLRVEKYERSAEQAQAIGLLPPAEPEAVPEISPDNVHHGAAPVGAAAAHRGLARLEGEQGQALFSRYTAPDEVIELPGHCSACSSAAMTRMFRTNIPFFKEVILMSDSCDTCGYRNSVVKGGGGIPPKGRRLTLKVTEPADLQRDVIKAESASIHIPELELEVSTGSMGGLITTVEGLVDSVSQALKKTQNFQLGDSAIASAKEKWQAFFAKLDVYKDGSEPWTLILEDPLANSFISAVSVEADPLDDPRLVVEDYERSAEENEAFGIDHLMAAEKEAADLAAATSAAPPAEAASDA